MSERYPEKTPQSEMLRPAEFFTVMGQRAIENYYSDNSELLFSDERIQNRIDRMTDILQAFGGEILPKATFDAMMIYESTSALDFAPAGRPDLAQKRIDFCQDYFTSPEMSDEEHEYVSAILGDLNFMDNEANNYRSNPNIYGYDDPIIKDLIQNDYHDGINTEHWDVRADSIDLGRMKEVLRKVNLESVMIKAAQLLDDLHKNHEHSAVEVFHKIAEAESFYAPICEIIGLDGFATSLRDKSLQIRYEKMGRYDVLDRAGELIERARNLGVEKVLSSLADDAPDRTNFVVQQMAGQRLNGENFVNTGDFLLRQKGDSSIFSGVYRIKSLGSLADKIYQDPNYQEKLPMDMLAYSFIVGDDTELQLVLADVVEKIEQSGAELCPAGTKKEAVFVQAQPERIDEIEQFLSEAGINAELRISDKNAFQSARVTFKTQNDLGQDVGVEIQFLTLEDRRNARLGSSNHLLYKLGGDFPEEDVEDLTNFMAEIYNRKKYMMPFPKEFKVNKASGLRSKTWLNRLNK